MTSFGTLRITNPITLAKWKASGKLDKLIEEGYLYAMGCGRFRKFICTCYECRRYTMDEKWRAREKQLLAENNRLLEVSRAKDAELKEAIRILKSLLAYRSGISFRETVVFLRRHKAWGVNEDTYTR